MKLKNAFVTGLLLVFISCKKNDIAGNIPSCIQTEIATNKLNPDWEFATVEEYIFQTKAVYVFIPDGRIIADAASIIKDSDCHTICSVGGYGGPQINMCNGENFYLAALFKRTIWQKK